MATRPLRRDDEDEAPRKPGDVPHFSEWLPLQVTNTDPVRAAAAEHIVGRWVTSPWYSHAQVLRALTRERNPHLLGAQLLGTDYADLFGGRAGSLIERGAAVLPFAPMPPVTCRHTYRSGRACLREAVPGTDVCGRHGGAWLTEDERRAVAAEIQDMILESAAAALRVVTDLMDNGRSEKVRLDAAVVVLDRAGIGPSSKVTLEVTENGQQAADEIRERLAALARRGELAHRSDEVVVEAEVVDRTD
jgi:hypothetical protein